jgi:hypothetical protein
MAGSTGTLEALAQQVGHVFAPLAQRLAAEQVKNLFRELGLAIPGSTPLPQPLLDALAKAASSASQLPDALGKLATAIQGGNTGAIVSAAAAVIEKVARLITALEELGDAFKTSNLAGMSAADVAALGGELAKRLVELSLLTYLDWYWPRTSAMLRVLGLTEYMTDPGTPGDPTRPPFTVRALKIDRLPKLLGHPVDHFVSVYQWGSPSFDGKLLLEVLDTILFNFAISTRLDPPDGPNPAILHIPPVRLLADPSVSPPGISLRLDADLGTDLSFEVPFLDPGWKLGVAVKGPLNSSIGLLLKPPAQLLFVPPPGSAVGFTVTLADKPEPIVLLSLDAGTRIEIASFEASVGVNIAVGAGAAGAEIDVGAMLRGGKAIIDTSQSDGFLQTILSGVHVNADFEIGVDFSSKTGVHFRGSGSLDIQLASHISLGPVELTALTLSAGVKDGGFPIGVTTNIEANLGPLTASVEGIGFGVTFTLAGGNHGNLGPIDARPGFLPPKGAGLAIDAGIVIGGGYLFFDPDKGEYAGVAELSIAELITVKAIGLISTKMPDGSSGFSLLVIITAEFTPIQLGFGFTLNGVGGLLGLNRAVLLDVLRDGVRTGAVNSIMFPTNVVANAPRIISDLKRVFPPKQDTFLVGPMLKFGWGTPSLITLSLGVIVEIPPGNIAILGVLKVAIPDEDTALILIQVSFLGAIDWDEQLLSFDASLFDSRVLFMTLEGDMAVRFKWGDNAGFVISVGGFHPAFTPPPGLHLPSSMKRLTISILDTPVARIKIDNYFAVTSNTVQFGAHAYLFFGFDAANINGEVGYDVLFQFSPFYFNALITGSLSIEVFGLDLLSITLRFSLEGPSPWRAKGAGSISILFFSIDIDFDITWGDPANTSLPPVHVMPLLVAEVDKQQNWKALPPPQSNLFVSLRKLDDSLLVLHPFGALSISQRAIPLALTLDKVGNQKPDDVTRLDITAATSNGTVLPLAPVNEQFAIAQFQTLGDSDKLSRPSYQQMKGGVIVGTSEAMQSSKMTRRSISYDVIIEDKEPPKPRVIGSLYRAGIGIFQIFLRGAAVARSPVSFAQKSLLQPFADKVTVAAGDGYSVASTTDNTRFDAGSRFESEAMARDYLRAKVAANPALDGTLHVLPDHEVAA